MKNHPVKIYSLIISIITTFLFLSCFNPFSPSLDTSTPSDILSDQKTVEGVFQNFRYAYTFKDTSIYGELLSENFVFTYFDYDLGVDVSWDRATDMKTTHGLFTNSQDLRLTWNNIIAEKGDSLNIDVTRSFNLSITFNSNDILNFYGYVDFTLKRSGTGEKWKIVRWRDLTNP
ncbi:MAG: hypothetical protein N2510_04130 [Ignavibacteria bacterium]|nr:hypothetical protein [Ignavibacteria bacterium]